MHARRGRALGLQPQAMAWIRVYVKLSRECTDKIKPTRSTGDSETVAGLPWDETGIDAAQPTGSKDRL